MSIQMNISETWEKELKEHGISSLQLERIIQLYKGCPNEVRISDVITGNKFLVDMDNRCRSHISLRQRVKSARERIFITSYLVTKHKRNK